MIANVIDLFNVSSLSFTVSLSSFVCRHDVEVQTGSLKGFMHSVQRRLCAFVCVCLFLCLYCVCLRPGAKMGSCTHYRGEMVSSVHVHRTHHHSTSCTAVHYSETIIA